MSDGVNGENSRVTFSVKELFAQINRSLESIDLKLDSKADMKDFDQLRSRVDAQGDRMRSLETRINTSEKIESANLSRRVFYVMLLGLVSSPFITYLLTTHP